ncbi:MAG: hypothetical protein K8W52_08830 [Deltaproteobacteria bacterium]|nr:hypothetical protein [Deltaproteobacteria bacterium]
MCSWIQIAASPSFAGAIGCVPEGDRPIGASCVHGALGPETGYDNCVLGAVCVGDGAAAICRAFCDPAAATSTCASSETCTTDPGVGGDGSPGMPMLGACAPT